MKFLLYPFAVLFNIIASIRSLLFKKRLLTITKVYPFTINVGNLCVGGSGKTPHVEYIVKLLLNEETSILSRGYKRKSKGVVIADEKTNWFELGDECYQYYIKFYPKISVTVAENRVKGAQNTLLKFPHKKLLVLDDAYQHQYIFRDVNLLLTDYNSLFYNDYLLPLGRLRESRNQAKRASAILVTKCKNDLSENEIEHIKSKIYRYAKCPVFFSKIKYDLPINFKNEQLNSNSIVLMTGLANANAFRNWLQNEYEILKHFEFRDHYTYSENDIFDSLSKYNNVPIVCTEKDFIKIISLKLDEKSMKNIYYVPIEIEFFGKEFDNYLLSFFNSKFKH